MEPWRGGRHVDSCWQEELDRVAAAGTPKEVAQALRALAKRARQQAEWVQDRSGAAIDRAAAAEIQHETAWRRFGQGPPAADRALPALAGAPPGGRESRGPLEPRGTLEREPDAESPARVAQALQVQAAGARGRALASRERLLRCVERAQRVAREAAGERERVARDRRERVGAGAGRRRDGDLLGAQPRVLLQSRGSGS